ncbi:hypothetical protein [Candidatus Rhabdochlamydia sp. T3358]|uniref:hypothetical protein n=1 Tax=Candidatus Rhabdochlamydia sp. T3358 TaxID=2099795 RepID=UPI001485AA12|nr:hypothetical protein [Candidatus Rhabdochlamydia sp. T3358]
MDSSSGIKICPALLTFLDLYHFPLRGQEQAEFMTERSVQDNFLGADKKNSPQI